MTTRLFVLCNIYIPTKKIETKSSMSAASTLYSHKMYLNRQITHVALRRLAMGALLAFPSEHRKNMVTR
jgi:hypothetical protein